MCLITFAYQAHPKYRLILAANRDEAYDRPTRAAQFWDEYPDIIAGKDLKAGGTWMGITRSGRWAAITNYRDPNIQKEDPPSRGTLVLDFLKSEQQPTHYLSHLDCKADRFMGFNLLVGAGDELGYYSNQQHEIQRVAPGVHGLSNHLFDTPWPKVERTKKGLNNLLDSGAIPNDKLFELLADARPAPDDQLPDTGISQDLEQKVSPVFIQGEDYGTRCSTVLKIANNGKVTFEERRFKSGTQFIEDSSRFEFDIKKE